MKSIPCLLVVLAVLAGGGGAAHAQSWTGDYILGGSVYQQGDAVFRVNATTKALTTVVSGITPSSTTHFVWEVIMAEDNSHFYALSAHYGAAAKIVKLDSTGLIVNTVYSGTTAFLKNAVNMHMDQNGKLVVLDCGGSATGTGHLYEIEPTTGGVTTIAALPRGDSFYGAACQDIDTGDYIAFLNDMCFRVDRISRAVTTLCNLGSRKARMSLAMDTLSGKAYAGTYGAPVLFEMDLVQGTWTTLNSTSMGGNYGTVFDRRCNAKMNYMYVAHGAFSSSTIPNGIKRFDTTGAMTTVASWPAGAGAAMPYSMVIEGSNEVQPMMKLPPNGRQILLSFPGHAGKSYACAINVSGIRPGVPLPDGRRICFNVDKVAVESLRGTLDVFLPGRVGLLNTKGNAMAGLDLNRLGKVVQGLAVTFQAVVLDSKAPQGIAVIAEPYTIRLE